MIEIFTWLTVTDAGISKDLYGILRVFFEFSQGGLSSNVTSDVLVLKRYTFGTIGDLESFNYAIPMNRLNFSPLDQNGGARRGLCRHPSRSGTGRGFPGPGQDDGTGFWRAQIIIGLKEDLVQSKLFKSIENEGILCRVFNRDWMQLSGQAGDTACTVSSFLGIKGI